MLRANWLLFAENWQIRPVTPWKALLRAHAASSITSRTAQHFEHHIWRLFCLHSRSCHSLPTSASRIALLGRLAGQYWRLAILQACHLTCQLAGLPSGHLAGPLGLLTVYACCSSSLPGGWLAHMCHTISTLNMLENTTGPELRCGLSMAANSA